MSWFAGSANETEAAKSRYCMFLAVAFDFPSAVTRFWTGIGDLSFSSNSYIGVGNLGAVSSNPEHVRLLAEPRSYQLHHPDMAPSWMTESDIDNSFGRSVTEYLGFLNPETLQIIDTPEVHWEGRIDKINRVDGDSPMIEVTAEHRLALLDKSDGWRYTHEHQQQFYASDFGLSLVPLIEQTEVLWGGFRVVPGSGGRNPGRGPGRGVLP